MMEYSLVFRNISVWAAFFAWLLAQSTKLFCHLARTGKIDFRLLASSGGMPSAHSAMAAALATSVALREGTGGSLFAVTVVFAVVVMFDAQSVRRAAGLQARLLNQILAEVLTDHRFSQTKLAELLGHTPLEVVLGMIMGVLTAIDIHRIFG